MGTATVLEVCRRYGIKRIVYISSAEVYGRPRTPRVAEDAALRPLSPYAAAKAGAEKLVEAFSSAFGLEGVILRPFAIYGPGLSRPVDDRYGHPPDATRPLGRVARSSSSPGFLPCHGCGGRHRPGVHGSAPAPHDLERGKRPGDECRSGGASDRATATAPHPAASEIGTAERARTRSIGWSPIPAGPASCSDGVRARLSARDFGRRFAGWTRGEHAILRHRAQGFVGRYVTAHLLTSRPDAEVLGVGRSSELRDTFPHSIRWASARLPAPLPHRARAHVVPPRVPLRVDRSQRSRPADAGASSLSATRRVPPRLGVARRGTDRPGSDQHRGDARAHGDHRGRGAGSSPPHHLLDRWGSTGRPASLRCPSTRRPPATPWTLTPRASWSPNVCLRRWPFAMESRRWGRVCSTWWAPVRTIGTWGPSSRVRWPRSGTASGPPSSTSAICRTTRDFIDVRDVAVALSTLVDHGTAGDTYNVAHGHGNVDSIAPGPRSRDRGPPGFGRGSAPPDEGRGTEPPLRRHPAPAGLGMGAALRPGPERERTWSSTTWSG